MSWGLIIVILIVLAGVSSMVSSQNKKQEDLKKADEFTSLTASRIEAYYAYLRRTSVESSIVGMTEPELRDFISNNIRAYRSEMKMVNGVGGALLVGGLIIAIIAGIAGKSLSPTIVIGGLSFGGVFYFIKAQEKRITARFAAKGLDVERLKIEQ